MPIKQQDLLDAAKRRKPQDVPATNITVYNTLNDTAASVEADAITADTLNNVLKTVFRIFGAAGTATKNVVRKETVLPLKMVSLEKLRFLLKMLGQESWKEISFSNYKSKTGLTNYSLELLRSEPDESGYNSLLINSETAVGIFCTVEAPEETTAVTGCGDMLEYLMNKEKEEASFKPISALPTTAEPVEAGPKDHNAYSWFAYTGAKPLTLKSQGGSTLVLNKGDTFGTRPSGSGKFIRLIGEKTGVTKVFTLAFDVISDLINNCKPAKAVMAKTEK